MLYSYCTENYFGKLNHFVDSLITYRCDLNSLISLVNQSIFELGELRCDM